MKLSLFKKNYRKEKNLFSDEKQACPHFRQTNVLEYRCESGKACHLET